MSDENNENKKTNKIYKYISVICLFFLLLIPISPSYNFDYNSNIFLINPNPSNDTFNLIESGQIINTSIDIYHKNFTSDKSKYTFLDDKYLSSGVRDNTINVINFSDNRFVIAYINNSDSIGKILIGYINNYKIFYTNTLNISIYQLDSIKLSRINDTDIAILFSYTEMSLPPVIHFLIEFIRILDKNISILSSYPIIDNMLSCSFDYIKTISYIDFKEVFFIVVYLNVRNNLYSVTVESDYNLITNSYTGVVVYPPINVDITRNILPVYLNIQKINDSYFVISYLRNALLSDYYFIVGTITDIEINHYFLDYKINIQNYENK